MDIHEKQNLLTQLAQVPGETTQKALDKEASKISQALSEETDYDIIESQIELLNAFSYRVAPKAFSIATALLDHLSKIELTYADIVGFRKDERKRYSNRSTLTVKILGALKRIRYHMPDEFLKLFLNYYLDANEVIKKEAADGLASMAKYHLEVFYREGDWGGLGPQPQQKVIGYIHKLNAAEKEKYFGALLVLCDGLLSPVIEGSTWGHRKVVLRTGSIPAVPDIISLRKTTIEILEELYDLGKTLDRKSHVINTLQTATRTPHMVRYTDDVLKMITSDIIDVLAVFERIATKEQNLEIVQQLEHDAYWAYKRAHVEDVKNAAYKIKEVIDRNSEYQIFKVLIGYEGIFYKWRSIAETDEEESRTLDNEIQQADKIRNQKMRDLVELVRDENIEEWTHRILLYAKIQSNDTATFPFFAKFLEMLGQKIPNFGMKLLNVHASELEGFITFIIWGLWETDKQSDLKKLLSHWITDGKYLTQVASTFEYKKEIDVPILEAVCAKAIEQSNHRALHRIIAVIVANYDHQRIDLVNSLMLRAIETLTALKDSDWVFNTWFRREIKEVIADMNDATLGAFLSNLLLVKKIGHEVEGILKAIADKSPQTVIRYFVERMKIEETRKSIFDYEAIPYQFYVLQEPLSKVPEVAIDSVRKSYDGNYGMFVFRGAKLIANIYPGLSERLQTKLIELIGTGNKDDIYIVMAILRNYQGEATIADVCRELIKALPEGAKELNEIGIILQMTGVVSGEYGLAEAYEAKKEELKDWLKDDDAKVRKFAQRYIANLESFIAQERKRVDEEIILEKHKYNEEKDE